MPSRAIALLLTFFLVAAAGAEQPAGRLTGRVRDESGHLLTGATVLVLDTPFGTHTDENGRYILERLPPGRYGLFVSHVGYEPARGQVEVRAGQEAVRDFTLRSTLYQVGEVTVVGQITSAQARALNTQNAALNIRHVASHELFSRFPDRNAAETLQRLPGIALDRDQGEGEYVQVRGLNPQLNSVAVNGRRIPTPTGDPKQGRSVGLDLLQIDNAGSVEIIKALTPDMDADALGGTVNMVLRQAPEEPEYGLSLAAGWNDKDARFSEWSSEIAEVSGAAGGRLMEDRLGLIAGASLSRTGRGSLLDQGAYAAPDTLGYSRWDNYDIRRHRYGLLAGADYRLTSSHDLRVNFTHNRFLDDEIRRRRQYDVAQLAERMEVRNRLEDQQFTMVELVGEQRLPRLTLGYAVSLARASEELPDRTYFLFQRLNTYSQGAGPVDLDLETSFPDLGPFLLTRNRYDNQEYSERDRIAQVDAELSYDFRDQQSSAKMGIKVLRKRKEARQRRWEYRPLSLGITTGENDYPYLDLRYDDGRAVALFPLERYRELDQLLNYEVDETVYAGYAMATLNWTPRLTSLLGVRGEITHHDSRHLDLLAIRRQTDGAYHNILPSLHLTCRLSERTNLRLAATSGLARPEYSFVLPIVTPPDDGEIFKGNPDLASARSYGLDLLLESFPRPLGLISVGVFAKRILDPTVVRSTRSDFAGTVYHTLEPINGDVGQLWGLELSWAQQLAALGVPLLRHTNLYCNYTHTKAEMDYGNARADNGPLPGNARHTANVGFTYDDAYLGRALTLSLNYRSPMLKTLQLGPDGDIWYDDEVHLDLSVRQGLSRHVEVFLKLNNLTNESEREMYGGPYAAGDQRRREREVYGRSGSLGLRLDI